KNSINGVEFLRLGKVADISGVQHELRRRRKSVNLVHRRFQCTCNVRIGRLIEAHVAVADLYEAEFAESLFSAQLRQPAEAVRFKHAAAHYAEGPGTCPCHAL